MKQSLFFILLLFLLPVALAIEDFPYNSINGLGIRYMVGMTYVNSTQDLCVNSTCLSTIALSNGSGTVTSVASGDGTDFTDFTDSGTVTLGTPTTLTGTTTNAVTTTSHTHAISTDDTGECTGGAICGGGHTHDWTTLLNRLFETVDNIYLDIVGTVLTLNETQLNATIDARDTDTTYTYADWQLLNRSAYDSLSNFTNDVLYVTNTTADYTTGTDVNTWVGNWSSDSSTYQIWTTTKTYIDSIGNWTEDSSLYKVWTDTKTYIDSVGNWTLDKVGYYTSAQVDILPKDWTYLQNYPVACPSGTYVTQIDDAITCTASNNGTVTSVGTSAPLLGTITTSGSLSITKADTSTDGYLSQTDWDTFNGKAGIGDCGAGEGVQNITTTGVECFTPAGASYTAGDGLDLTGTQFNVSAETCIATDATTWNGTAFECMTPTGGSSIWTDVDGNATFTTGNVGIGTTTPIVALDVVGDVYSKGSFIATGGAFTLNKESASGANRINVWSDNVLHWAGFNFYRYMGNRTTPSAVLANTYIQTLNTVVYDGTSTNNVAKARTITTEDHNTTNHGVRWLWEGTPTGSTTRAEWATLRDGNLGIGTDSPTTKLEVNGNVTADYYYGDGSKLTGISGGSGITWDTPINTTITYDSNDAYDVGSTTAGPDTIFLANYLEHVSDSNTNMRLITDEINFEIGGVSMLNLKETTQDRVKIGEQYAYDIDFVVDGSSVAALLHVDGGLNQVGIGTSSTTSMLTVDGAIETIPRASSTCGATTEGAIYYDSDDNHFYGCDGSSWNQLDN